MEYVMKYFLSIASLALILIITNQHIQESDTESNLVRSEPVVKNIVAPPVIEMPDIDIQELN